MHRLFLRAALLFTVACREKRQLATSVVQMACTVATTTTAAAIQKNNKPTATIIYGGTTQQTTKAVGAQFDVKRAGTTHTYTDPHTPGHTLTHASFVHNGRRGSSVQIAELGLYYYS